MLALLLATFVRLSPSPWPTPTPTPNVQVIYPPRDVVLVPLPCSVLLKSAHLSTHPPMTPTTVGKLYAAALELRGLPPTHAQRVIFDEAYNDVMNCFSWSK